MDGRELFELRFEVECDKVRGQQRPRTTRSGHVYELDADKDWKERIAWAYKKAGGAHLGKAPVSVTVETYRKLPESAPKSVQLQHDTFKPDADNLAKSVLDALNGVAYDDDSQVVRLTVVKWPRTRQKTELLAVTVREAARERRQA